MIVILLYKFIIFCLFGMAGFWSILFFFFEGVFWLQSSTHLTLFLNKNTCIIKGLFILIKGSSHSHFFNWFFWFFKINFIFSFWWDFLNDFLAFLCLRIILLNLLELFVLFFDNILAWFLFLFNWYCFWLVFFKAVVILISPHLVLNDRVFILVSCKHQILSSFCLISTLLELFDSVCISKSI